MRSSVCLQYKVPVKVGDGMVDASVIVVLERDDPIAEQFLARVAEPFAFAPAPVAVSPEIAPTDAAAISEPPF